MHLHEKLHNFSICRSPNRLTQFEMGEPIGEHDGPLLNDFNYAGINLTGYHPPPGTPRLLHRNVCPAPGLMHNRKCPGVGPINDDVPEAGHLHQHKKC